MSLQSGIAQMRRGRKAHIEAISGADVVEKRSNLVRLMASLMNKVMIWGEKLIYQGTKDDSLPPAVLKAYAARFSAEPGRWLFLSGKPADLYAVAAGMKAFELAATATELRATLKANTARLRGGLEAAGFTVKPGPTPILPVMLGDAVLASKTADELLKRGIYVIGFSYPVVPQGQARIRLQASAAHTDEQIDRTVEAFAEVGRELGIV